jgi:cytosine/adenosine deaminase-related metal-dependent hydrolase
MTHCRPFPLKVARIVIASLAAPIAASPCSKIVFVGSTADARRLIGARTRVEQLDGRLLLPGLFDSHLHPISMISVESCDRHNRHDILDLADAGHGEDIAHTRVLKTWFACKAVYVRPSP